MNFRVPNFDVAPTETSALLSPGELVLDMWRSAVKYKRPIKRSISVFLALAVLYLLVTPKQYLATAEMMIDPRKSEEVVPQRSSTPQADAPVDASVVESEGTVLQSENVILAVIKKLNLVNSPTFDKSSGVIPSILGFVKGLFGISGPTDYERLRATVEAFQDRLTVKRVGVTYVFDISFLSPDPAEAAAIANGIAAAYVDDLLAAKYAARQRASGWMQERLNALAQQATKSELAVAEFKRVHAIVSTGGRLIDEQQVGEMQSQLTLARAAKNNAKAKLDRIEEILGKRKLDLSVADALSNQVIINLRDSYVDLSKRAADLESRLGRNHEAPMRLRADMEQVSNSIFEELRRIGEGYKSDYQIASEHEAAIQKDLASAVAQSASTNEAQVELAQLESEAQASRALYDTFLQRFGEVVQQQSSPMTETRVVTEASAPLKKSKPKTLLTLIGATFVGSLVGFGYGWVREKTDRSLRSASQAESVVKAPVIASVPHLDGHSRKSIAREAINRPLSAFSESIRDIRLFLEWQRQENGVQVVGITSAIGSEGKSTIAANLAGLIAKSRARILLIDGDLRSRSLTTLIGSQSKGIADILKHGVPMEQGAVFDEAGRYDFMPAGVASVDSGELLASREMKELTTALRQRYDLILIDLPAILGVADVRAVAPVVDGYLVVAEWGRTPIETLSEAVSSSGRIQERLMGVVLNKVGARGPVALHASLVSKYLISA